MMLQKTMNAGKGNRWLVKGQELFLEKPMIMGILNVTPDSFSDGGKYLDINTALDRVRDMISEGADIIDIGGESTKPGAKPVKIEEEMRRVLPIIQELSAETDVLISIDTQKSKVAEAALAAGAHIVNDISAGRNSPEMFPLIAESQAGYVMMHMQGTPEFMQKAPHYQNVVKDICSFFEERLNNAEASEVNAAQIVLDPGIGFGKTLQDNLHILANMYEFHDFDRPLLLGASRKSFIGMFDQSDPEKRLGGSLAAALAAYLQNVQIFRVHDILETLQTLEVFTAIQKCSD